MRIAPGWKPAALHPSLTEERLRAIAQIVWDQATAVAEIAEPERGDDGWVLGCRRYQWVRHALSKAALGELVEFLSVTPRSTHFLVRVGGVPIRIYRGDRSKPVPTRYATASRVEAEQLEMVFGSDHRLAGPLRLVLETDERGMPTRVSFACVSESGELTNVTEIQVDRADSLKHRAMQLVKAEPKVAVAPLSLADAAARSRRRPRLESQEGA